MSIKKHVKLGLSALALSVSLNSVAAEDPIKVGILHSLSGTMAISETALKDTMLMLIEKQNAAGGVLGRQLEPVVVDPADEAGDVGDPAADGVGEGLDVGPLTAGVILAGDPVADGLLGVLAGGAGALDRGGELLDAHAGFLGTLLEFFGSQFHCGNLRRGRSVGRSR